MEKYASSDYKRYWIQKWTATAVKYPAECSIIMFSICYIWFQNKIDLFQSNSLTYWQIYQTQTYISKKQKKVLKFPHLDSHGNVLMILRIWSLLHSYKHSAMLYTALKRSTLTTKFYTFFIVAVLFSLSILTLSSLTSFKILQFDFICVYFLVSDIKTISRLILHAMTSRTNDEVAGKIIEGMVKLLPKNICTSVFDAIALATGYYSTSPALRMLGFSGAVAILMNTVVFTVVTPIVLVWLLQVEGYGFASWYESRNFNFLYRGEHAKVQLSLKARVLLALNLYTNQNLKLPSLLKVALNTPVNSIVFVGVLIAHYIFELTPLELLGKIYNLRLYGSSEPELKNDFETKLIPKTPEVVPKSRKVSLETPDRGEARSTETCLEILNSQSSDMLSNTEILNLIKSKHLAIHSLEKTLQNASRAVEIRRLHAGITDLNLPQKYYDYSIASKACCENIIGYMPLPIGLAGPLTINRNENIHLPLATTEGALVASTCRGCKALRLGSGVTAMEGVCL